MPLGYQKKDGRNTDDWSAGLNGYIIRMRVDRFSRREEAQLKTRLRAIGPRGGDKSLDGLYPPLLGSTAHFRSTPERRPACSACARR